MLSWQASTVELNKFNGMRIRKFILQVLPYFQFIATLISILANLPTIYDQRLTWIDLLSYLWDLVINFDWLSIVS